MACKFCGRPVVLIPSAAERARRYGETPAFYTRLFPDHAACIVADRSRQARELAIRHGHA